MAAYEESESVSNKSDDALSAKAQISVVVFSYT